jgi:RNA polymerase sigma-70 factor (ECF subfamily)
MSETNRTALLNLLVASYDDLKQRLTRRSGSADLACEVLQDTFLRLNSASDIGQVKNLNAYLFRVALSVASNRRVAERRHLAVTETDAALHLIDESPDPERIVAARSEIDALKRVIRELPARRREILLAALVDEVPHRKIARRFGISLRTVQVELKQAVMHCAVRLGRGVGAPRVPRRRLSLLDRDRVRSAQLLDSGAAAADRPLMAADDRGC